MRTNLFLCLILGLATPSVFAQPLSKQQEKLFEQNSKLLFLVERDYNRNIVLYFGHGAEKPTSVKSHWLMLEKGKDKTEPVTSQEQGAYGHQFKDGILTLNPVRSIPMKLEFDKELDRPVAYVSIDNKRVRLVRVYFEVKRNFLGIPTGAKYFDLHGIDVATKKPVRKRIYP